MAEQKASQVEGPHREKTDDLSQRLDAVGWALFLIWMGIAFLADVGWGWGLLGIGVIILGEAAVRGGLNLKIEGFWIVCGALFFLGGLWQLFHVPWPLPPVLLILVGLAVLWGAFSGRQLMKK